MVVVEALEELRRFMIVNGEALKEKQKLMRNLRVSYTLSPINIDNIFFCHDVFVTVVVNENLNALS